MRSIRYGGVDFSLWCSAEVVERCGHAVAPRTVAVPGRAGAVLLGGEVPPRVIAVRLDWDSILGRDAAMRARARHALYAALMRTAGAELVVPSDPEVTYRDAVCTGCGEWTSLLADGHAEVEFTCYDPIGYGTRRSTDTSTFAVGGTWTTWPQVTLTAVAGSSVVVTDKASGAYVAVERAFSGGESVVLDFQAETCLVGGADCSADVSIESEFFSIGPGGCELGFSGCSAHTVGWHERWV